MSRRKVHDFEINQAIIRVLAKHKIDTRSVKFTSRGGVVYFEGVVLMQGESALDSVPTKTMEMADLQMKNIEGVKRIRYQLLNMSKSDAGWRHIKFVKSDANLVWKVKGADLDNDE